MQKSRIILKQGTHLYRFIGLDSSSDGSIIVFLDRDARSKEGSMELVDGRFIPTNIDHTKRLPSGRFSVHVSGCINRYAAGKRVGTIYIEPIYRLTHLARIGIISIPRVSRLDSFDANEQKSETITTLEIPTNIDSRINFLIEIGPKPQQPTTFGVALNYELYSIILRLDDQPMNLDNHLSNHFICGMPTFGEFESQQGTKQEAELAFHHNIHGKGVIVFRDGEGAYVAMASCPMARPPELQIQFSDPSLRIEIIDRNPVTHKVRFWIIDKTGRNKKDDLRKLIKEIIFVAEL